MTDVINQLPATWILIAAHIALFAFVVLVALVVWAVFQGREVSIWPPRIGARLPAGPLVRAPSGAAEPSDQFRRFCETIVGRWWSIRRWDPPTIGVMTISPYAPTRTVKVTGDTYTLDGEPVEHWESEGSCVNPQDRKLYYYWTGRHTSADKMSVQEYKGFCEITFREPSGHPVRADSVFSDTNLANLSGTTFKNTRLLRCTEDEQNVLDLSDRSLIAPLLRKKYGETR